MASKFNNTVVHIRHGNYVEAERNGLDTIVRRESPTLVLASAEGPNEFLEIMKRGNEFPLDKWVHYFFLYERYFASVRERAKRENRKVRFLEIGLFRGGSVELWTKYFGEENLEYYGVDIDPTTKRFEEKFPHVKVFLGDQANPDFWNAFKNQVGGYFDVVLDDGGHAMQQQIVTLEQMFERVRPDGGFFFCEDTHTSYWRTWGGGYQNPSTFVEHAKDLADVVNEYHVNKEGHFLNQGLFSKQIYGIYFHDSVVVVERRVCPEDYRVISCYFEGTQVQ